MMYVFFTLMYCFIPVWTQGREAAALSANGDPNKNTQILRLYGFGKEEIDLILCLDSVGFHYTTFSL
jgi:hypothetical protein